MPPLLVEATGCGGNSVDLTNDVADDRSSASPAVAYLLSQQLLLRLPARRWCSCRGLARSGRKSSRRWAPVSAGRGSLPAVVTCVGVGRPRRLGSSRRQKVDFSSWVVRRHGAVGSFDRLINVRRCAPPSAVDTPINI